MTRIAVSLDSPPTSPPRAKRSLGWLFGILGLAIGSAGGWFAKTNNEIDQDMQRYVEILTPMLAYDRDYHEMRARSMNDDMRLTSAQIYLASAEGLDVAELLNRSMPTHQVP